MHAMWGAESQLDEARRGGDADLVAAAEDELRVATAAWEAEGEKWKRDYRLLNPRPVDGERDG